MRRGAGVLISICVTAGAALLGAGGSAAASPLMSHARMVHSGAHAGLQQSSNWSGVADTGRTYTHVTGSWAVPRVTVTRGNRYAADWVGIGGYNTGDLIQAGTASESVGGRANYYAWTEILPASEVKISNFTVHAGDAVTVDIVETAPSQWTITVSNATTGKSYVLATQYTSSNSSAEWIHEAPTVGLLQSRLATTTPADFDHGSVNGTTSIAAGGTQNFIQLAGSTYATPSGLDSEGDGLAVADGKNAPAPPPS